MAGNSVTFAVRVLQASHPGSRPEDFSGAAVRGIAIAVATATCFIHTVSRRGGIVLNNLLAIVKVGILLLIIITAIVVSAGGFKDGETGEEVSSVTAENLDVGSAFDPISKDVSEEANGFAQAFLAIGKDLFGTIPHTKRMALLTLIYSIRVLGLQPNQLRMPPEPIHPYTQFQMFVLTRLKGPRGNPAPSQNVPHLDDGRCLGFGNTLHGRQHLLRKTHPPYSQSRGLVF